jgi:hypothetical protein
MILKNPKPYIHSSLTLVSRRSADRRLLVGSGTWRHDGTIATIITADGGVSRFYIFSTAAAAAAAAAICRSTTNG